MLGLVLRLPRRLPPLLPPLGVRLPMPPVPLEKNGLRDGLSIGDGDAGTEAPGDGVEGRREDLRGSGGRARRAWITNCEVSVCSIGCQRERSRRARSS